MDEETFEARPKQHVFWQSPAPERCDFSGTPIDNEFVDGHVPGDRRWGCFHPGIYKQCGGTLGTGWGQRYVKQPEGTPLAGRWLKVEG